VVKGRAGNPGRAPNRPGRVRAGHREVNPRKARSNKRNPHRRRLAQATQLRRAQGEKRSGQAGQGGAQKGESAPGEKRQGQPGQGEPRKGEGQQGEKRQGQPAQGEPRKGEGQQGEKRDQPGSRQSRTTVQIRPEQRTRITETIRGLNVRPITNVGIRVAVGVVVPRRVELRPLPPAIIEFVPEFRRYRFFEVPNQIIIVDPDTFEIVEVISF